MEPIEDTFPEAFRQDYSGIPLQARIDWVVSLNKDKNCPKLECEHDLKSSPKGTVPGFW